MNVPAPSQPTTAWRAEIFIVLALVAGWIGFVAIITGGERTVMFDTFRDMAWAENIRAGRVWADPSLPYQPYWYAPGNPLFFAAVTTLTGTSVLAAYAYSPFWLNVLLPVLLYLLVRVAFDRPAALLALPAVYFGSMWWMTHAFAGMPSIQGVALNLAALLTWHQCVVTSCPPQPDVTPRPGRAWGWAALTAVLMALSAWHHPLCASVVAGAVFLHALLGVTLPSLRLARWPYGGRARRILLTRMAIVAVLAGALAAPLILHLLALPQNNPVPLSYVAREASNSHFYGHSHAPLMVPLTVFGAFYILRKMPQAAWVVAYFVVGLAGQASGYLRNSYGWPVPCLLPHEFQWHTQLAAGICAAVAIVALARAIANRARRPRRAYLLAGMLLSAATLGPALRWLPDAGGYLIYPDRRFADQHGLLEWIRRHTTIEAVFACPPQTGYSLVAGLTGRKCVALPAGHLNPAVDATGRLEDLRIMLTTGDEATFLRLAARYGANYLLLTPESRPVLLDGRPRAESWACLEPAFVSPDGATRVYRILR